jgi:hypothetical protein
MRWPRRHPVISAVGTRSGLGRILGVERACLFPREVSNREHDDLVKGFREANEKLLGQTGSDAAPSLRDLAERVRKVKAMHFRRTRKFE